MTKTYCKDGPASISKFKSAYYKHGKLNRYGCPAIICSNGLTLWSINGKAVTYEVRKWLKEHDLNSCICIAVLYEVFIKNDDGI